MYPSLMMQKLSLHNMRTNSGYRVAVIPLLVLCLAVQALIPRGFMPGDISGSESFVVMCPGYDGFDQLNLPDKVTQAWHQSHEVHDHDGSPLSKHFQGLSSYCLFSALGVLGQFTFDSQSVAFQLQSTYLSIEYAVESRLFSPRKYFLKPLGRAPPLSTRIA